MSTQVLRMKNHFEPDATARNQRRSNDGCCSTSSVLNSLTAGYIAGISGIVVGHPFESVKVWLQTKTENQNKFLKLANSTNSSSVRGSVLPVSARNTTKAAAAAKSMSTLATQQQQQVTRSLTGQFKSKGYYQDWISTSRNKLRALYSGVTGPFLTVGVIQCVTFALYDSTRRVLHDRDTRHANDSVKRDANDYILNDSLTNVAISGASAGVIVSLFTGPMTKIKVQQQVTGHGYRQAMYETLFRGGRMISARTLFHGFGPHFLLETAGRATYYTTYEGLKRAIETRRNNEDGGTLITIQERMICAALAGITNWSIFFPFDAVRSRLYAQRQSTLQKNNNNIKPCLEMVRSMYYEKSPSGSLKAFYRGFGVTVVRAGPVAAAVLPIYDLSLKWLSSS